MHNRIEFHMQLTQTINKGAMAYKLSIRTSTHLKLLDKHTHVHKNKIHKTM